MRLGSRSAVTTKEASRAEFVAPQESAVAVAVHASAVAVQTLAVQATAVDAAHEAEVQASEARV